MNIFRIVYKTFSEGNRNDKEVVLLSSGLARPFDSPQGSRSHYEFSTPSGTRRFHPDEMVVFDTLEEFLGVPSEEILKKYPELEWEEWFDETLDGEPMEEFLAEERG